MSQNDFNLANAGGASFRADANSALQALASLSSGAGAPSTTYANQLWADSSNHVLKRRNEGNSAWRIVGTLDTDVVLFRFGAYTIGLRDYGKLLQANTAAATFTLTLPLAASAGEGFTITIQNTGGAGRVVTIEPSGSDTIDGTASLELKDGRTAALWSTGSAWISVVAPSQHQGMELMEVADLTNGGANDLSSYEFSLDFEDGYKYLLDVRGMSSSGEDWLPFIQFRDSGGTLHSTTGDYRVTNNTVTTTGQSNLSLGAVRLYGFSGFAGHPSSRMMDVSAVILDAMDPTVRTRVLHDNLVFEPSVALRGFGGGIRDAIEADKGLILSCFPNTMDGGTAYIWRIKEPS